jgi:hypothetical protein
MTHFSLNQCLHINVLVLRCQVYKAGVTQIMRFLGVPALCSVMPLFRRFGGTCYLFLPPNTLAPTRTKLSYPEDRGSTFLRNIT